MVRLPPCRQRAHAIRPDASDAHTHRAHAMRPNADGRPPDAPTNWAFRVHPYPAHPAGGTLSIERVPACQQGLYARRPAKVPPSAREHGERITAENAESAEGAERTRRTRRRERFTLRQQRARRGRAETKEEEPQRTRHARKISEARAKRRGITGLPRSVSPSLPLRSLRPLRLFSPLRVLRLLSGAATPRRWRCGGRRRR